MIEKLKNAPLPELWEINALTSLWQVAKQADRSITFAQVAKSFQQEHHERLEVTEANAIAVIGAIAQLIQEKSNASTRTREVAETLI